MRRGDAHPTITEYRLCKEFGWTLTELARQPAKKVEEFILIVGEIDRQTEREVEKAKRESRARVR